MGRHPTTSTMPRATPTGAGGDALIQALQGKLAAPFTGTLADALTDSDAQLAVTVASGHVLLRGVIEVASTPSGKELIRYRKAVKDAASPGKWPLSELIRGYKGTTAASGASGASVSLKSRAFVQALCRPNVSAWIVIDKTLQAVQGCHVTDASISATKEGAVELTGTLTGCRVFNARPSSVGAEAQASAASIVVEDAKVFFTGQKIQNVTKSDDNSGKGYAVTAVDKRTNTLTVAPGISGAWAVDDVVDALRPRHRRGDGEYRFRCPHRRDNRENALLHQQVLHTHGVYRRAWRPFPRPAHRHHAGLQRRF